MSEMGSAIVDTEFLGCTVEITWVDSLHEASGDVPDPPYFFLEGSTADVWIADAEPDELNSDRVEEILGMAEARWQSPPCLLPESLTEVEGFLRFTLEAEEPVETPRIQSWLDECRREAIEEEAQREREDFWA